MTKISQLSSIGDSLAIGDQFLIRDIDDAVTPNKSVTISGMTRALDTGTVLAPALAFASDKNTGIYSPGADTLAFVEGGTEAMRIDSSGQLIVAAKANGTTNGIIYNVPYTGGQANGVSQVLQAATGGAANALARINMSTVDLTLNNSSFISFATSPGGSGAPSGDLTTERMRISPAGNVGIGTSSPTELLEISATTDPKIHFIDVGNTTAKIGIVGSTALGFEMAGTERLRIDSSGRLLIGTSSARSSGTQTWLSQIEAVSTVNAPSVGLGIVRNQADIYGGYLSFAKTRGTSNGATTIVTSGDELGGILFSGADGSDLNSIGASIVAVVDGTPGANDMPGRLVFSTTADGASSPTERLRIDSSGRVGIGTSSPASLFHLNASASGGGAIFSNQGYNYATVSQVISSADAIFGGGVIASDVGQEVKKNNADAAHYIKIQTGEGISFHTNITGASGTSVNRGTNERLRIDSSGRLLVGTSTSINNLLDAAVQIAGTSTDSYLSVTRFSSVAGDPAGIILGRSKSSTKGVNTAVSNGDYLGAISFSGANGTTYTQAASIGAEVDGAVTGGGAGDMPGRLVFSTTADGASSPTEQLRISNGGTVIYNQPAPAAVDVTATLTVANLTAKIITSSTAAAVTMTLPTGTLMDGGFSGLYNNMAFEWSVINTGATNAVTVQGGASHTLVGSGTVAANNSVRFSSRRTGTTTWVTYRVG